MHGLSKKTGRLELSYVQNISDSAVSQCALSSSFNISRIENECIGENSFASCGHILVLTRCFIWRSRVTTRQNSPKTECRMLRRVYETGKTQRTQELQTGTLFSPSRAKSLGAGCYLCEPWLRGRGLQTLNSSTKTPKSLSLAMTALPAARERP